MSRKRSEIEGGFVQSAPDSEFEFLFLLLPIIVVAGFDDKLDFLQFLKQVLDVGIVGDHPHSLVLFVNGVELTPFNEYSDDTLNFLVFRCQVERSPPVAILCMAI